MIEELLPQLVQWSAYHEGIGHDVYSAFELRSGTLIDPMEPPEGLEAVARLRTPERIVLTNRHHYRHADRFAERFGCPVLCHEAGLEHSDEEEVSGFFFDEQLAEHVRALELASICAEETTLLLEVADGVLCFGDGVTRAADGSLAFMPDRLLGEDPDAVRQGLGKNLRRMFEEDFDALLFAHAEPVLGGGREMLRSLLSGRTVHQLG
ncbi:MAG TPA: hypothetical protein VL979_05885 [Solirubrobacteraceae bacterium]|nr:hypothetical protein [Solirubrobacteraceae bacterium]